MQALKKNTDQSDFISIALKEQFSKEETKKLDEKL
jgi:hypothetical protein